MKQDTERTKREAELFRKTMTAISYKDYKKSANEICRLCGVQRQTLRLWIRGIKQPSYLAKREINKFFNQQIYEV